MKYDIPKFHELMLPLLEGFADGGSHDWTKFEQTVAKTMGLSKRQVEIEYSNNPGRRVFLDRLAWARTYLYKAKLINKTDTPRVYKITKRGQDLLSNKPSNLTPKFLRETYQDFWDTHVWKSAREDTDENDATPEEQISSSVKKLRELIKDELLDRLGQTHPAMFEKLVVELLEKMGYGKGLTTRYTSDGGVDGLIKGDTLGFEQIYIQAKRWKNKVGRREITQFIGDILAKNAKKGIFITTSEFRDEAIKAAGISNPHIILIDGESLGDHLIDYELGVSVRVNHKLYRIDTDYFEIPPIS